MACLEPRRAVEASCFVLPVTLSEAALAIEDEIPRIVNSTKGVGDCRAVAAITDRFEACAFQRTIIESIPDMDSPIMPLEGQGTTQAVLDSWLAKGTLLGEDGRHCVFVAFMDVMRRPFQGSWTVQTITVLGTKQSLQSHLEDVASEAEMRTDAVLVEAPRPDKWGTSARPEI